jgi:superfamily I DNA/RNA helicase
MVPTGVLSASLQGVVDRVRQVIAAVNGWTTDDTLGQRRVALAQLIEHARGAADRADWETFTQGLSDDVLLSELRGLLFAENDDEMHSVTVAMHERLGLVPPPEAGSDRIRIMTMHGAKGLSANVVFIPGLEDQVFPGPKRGLAAGLVLEGARTLYVSLTRARAAVICTSSKTRFQNGRFGTNSPSRYLTVLGNTVTSRTTGLSKSEASAIATTVAMVKQP